MEEVFFFFFLCLSALVSGQAKSVTAQKAGQQIVQEKPIFQCQRNLHFRLLPFFSSQSCLNPAPFEAQQLLHDDVRPGEKAHLSEQRNWAKGFLLCKECGGNLIICISLFPCLFTPSVAQVARTCKELWEDKALREFHLSGQRNGKMCCS